mmetsp:Transcript_123535/g.384565  ORF Transcript_123535/g.384565 Transcript_123535/m.384565 type:complete len:215 (-) Transcript_123535:37-681(-)
MRVGPGADAQGPAAGRRLLVHASPRVVVGSPVVRFAARGVGVIYLATLEGAVWQVCGDLRRSGEVTAASIHETPALLAPRRRPRVLASGVPAVVPCLATGTHVSWVGDLEPVQRELHHAMRPINADTLATGCAVVVARGHVLAHGAALKGGTRVPPQAAARLHELVALGDLRHPAGLVPARGASQEEARAMQEQGPGRWRHGVLCRPRVAEASR